MISISYFQPQQEDRIPAVTTSQSNFANKASRSISLHQEWDSDYKPMQHTRNPEMEFQYEIEKGLINSKLTTNALNPEIDFRFDMVNSNKWRFNDRAKEQVSKEISFPCSSTTSLNSNTKEQHREDPYGSLFSNHMFEKPNESLSQQLFQQSDMNCHEVIKTYVK